eukprot:gb/GECG01009578.1/.p1 GENE.gb/GECG01009578.1/~~gb/GECG01009578.1/.p1  ORF type:complete len:109 (+),score=7.87 gb/GECG01009578.1/:1-327(+)
MRSLASSSALHLLFTKYSLQMESNIYMFRIPKARPGRRGTRHFPEPWSRVAFRSGRAKFLLASLGTGTSTVGRIHGFVVSGFIQAQEMKLEEERPPREENRTNTKERE